MLWGRGWNHVRALPISHVFSAIAAWLRNYAEHDVTDTVFTLAHNTRLYWAVMDVWSSPLGKLWSLVYSVCGGDLYIYYCIGRASCITLCLVSKYCKLSLLK